MQSSTSLRQDSPTPPGSCDLDTLAAVLAELREEMRATREAIEAPSQREIVVSLIREHGYHQAVQDFRPQGGGRARRRAGRLVPRPPHIRAVDGRPS